ncbi:MAG TPA: PEP/pyruvate-binding domain-containing protein [Candidatus Acidoferrum sp.]|nr:PEP/pyruvate-binding domain-containing protein [Candidatus Acidoferrum sp.]
MTALLHSLSDADAATAALVGPKASTLARLRRAGVSVPDAFCLTADAYRARVTGAGVGDAAAGVAGADLFEGRKLALKVRLAMLNGPLESSLAEATASAYARLSAGGGLVAVRSSALCEDTADASFAGQFDTFLGIANETELNTAIHACWASLWSSRALRYMRAHEIDPAHTAMALLVQRMIEADAAGGALSQTPDEELVITGAWGLGSVIAQGEVVPDRFVLTRGGDFERVEPGRKDRLVSTSAGAGPLTRAVPRNLVEAPCLSESEAVELGRMVLIAEAALGAPVEVEWAKDARGFHLLQARPLRVETPHPDYEPWRRHPGLRGQPAGVGWGSGPACLVIHEHDLDHVKAGDVLVTQVAGPALTAVLPRVAGVVAELGGSTSHLAALARERGIPAVLGVLDATRRIPEGATVAVDGVAGVVRWMR